MEENIIASKKFQGQTNLSIIREYSGEPEFTFHASLYDNLLGIIDVATTATPLLNKPLDIVFNRVLKRGFDIVISIIMIVGILSWLIPIIGILIWVDSKGPLFFLQKRNKRNADVFTCIKFRSMILNENSDTLPALPNDKRITRIGHFLRDNYIDELPQFFNVLWGDMSVIGPRPHMVSDNIKFEQEIEYYSYRHRIKPGITGLAQVLGYVGAIEDIQKMKERVSMDIFYQRRWSIKLDIIIMWRTMLKQFHF
jgi:putative colanic acid biosynthesis UDP-glucose lipid carrier transferase